MHNIYIYIYTWYTLYRSRKEQLVHILLTIHWKTPPNIHGEIWGVDFRCARSYALEGWELTEQREALECLDPGILAAWRGTRESKAESHRKMRQRCQDVLRRQLRNRIILAHRFHLGSFYVVTSMRIYMIANVELTRSRTSVHNTCTFSVLWISVPIDLVHFHASTANLRTKILDFRWFDSSGILLSRGGILRSVGTFPEDPSQQVLAGIILVTNCWLVLWITASPSAVTDCKTRY